MKILVKILSLALLVFGLANCGGSGGGGGAEEPKTGLAGDATSIIYNNGGSGSTSVISWQSSFANLGFPTGNSNCIEGLTLSSADDTTVAERVAELQSLLNESSVVKGTSSSEIPANTPFITINYSNDTSAVYFIAERDDVSTDDETLSNGAQIAEFFEMVRDDLMDDGQRYCPGKGDDIPTQ